MALSALIGNKVIKKGAKEGEHVNVDTSSFAKDGYVVGLYFSAHWCPPCRAFTPKLADWYNKLKGGAIGDKFEIVFLSSDRDEKSYNEYYSEMPWHAVSYDDRTIKVSLYFIEQRKWLVVNVSQSEQFVAQIQGVWNTYISITGSWYR